MHSIAIWGKLKIQNFRRSNQMSQLALKPCIEVFCLGSFQLVYVITKHLTPSESTLGMRSRIPVQWHTKHTILGIYITWGWIFQGVTNALIPALTVLGRFPGKLHAQPRELGQTFSLTGSTFLFYFSRDEAERGSGEKNSLLALVTATE